MTTNQNTTTIIRNLVTELFGDHALPDNRKSDQGRKLRFSDINPGLYECELLERVLVDREIFVNIRSFKNQLMIETIAIG
jgi:hypothetical protein